MLEQLGSRKFGAIIFDAQRDHSDVNGNAPKHGSAALFASIASLLKKNRHRIDFIYTTYTVEDPFNVMFKESWRFIDTGLHPECGDVVRQDSLSSTGFSVHFRPVAHATGGSFIGERVLCKRAFQPHSSGCALDDVVAAQCKEFRTEHLRDDVPFPKCPCDISNWLVMGNMYNQTLVNKVISMLDGTKWLLRDLCRGLLSNKNGNWVNSFELMHEAPMIRGVPVHIQPECTPTLQPLSEVFTVDGEDVLKNVKHEWRTLISSIQTTISLFHVRHKDKAFKRVDSDGREVTHCTGGCENIVEFVDERILSSPDVKDPISRNTYNTALRTTRRSLVDLCFGVPPIENPYGAGLMNGRGSLPFFGPNHLLVKMYVVNAPRSERTTYHFEYDTRLSSQMPELTMSNPVIVYQGYLPHHENTRHAWKECVVVALDSLVEPPAKKRRMLTLMEGQWIKALEKIDNIPVMHIPILTIDDIRTICHPEVAHFMKEALHLKSGESFVNWVKYAPKSSIAILRMWKSAGVLSLQSIVKKERKTPEDVSYIYNAFRVPQTESNWEEFQGAAKHYYGNKFVAQSWSDQPGMRESFLNITIDNELLNVGLGQLKAVLGTVGDTITGADLPLALWKGLVYNDEAEAEAKSALMGMSIVDAKERVEFVCIRNIESWLEVTCKLTGSMDESSAIAHSMWISDQLESPGCSVLYDEKIYHPII